MPGRYHARVSLRRVASLACLLAALACSGAPGPRASGAAAREYFPLEPGTRWVYEVRAGWFSRTRLDVIARGERAVRDSDAPLFLVEERIERQVMGLEQSGYVGYRREAGYLTRIAAVEVEADGSARTFGGAHGVSLLPLDPKPGQRWNEQGDVFAAHEAGEASRIGWSAELTEYGRMRVPAGTFDDVIVVKSEQWDPGWRTSEPLHTYEDYYARGVGLIKSVAHNHAAAFFARSVEQVLLEVEFPAAPAAPR
jgi:hypothetical protein